MTETAKSKIKNFKNQITEKFNVGEANGFRTYIGKLSPINVLDMLDDIERSVSTDKLSVEKLQEELESCIQTLITISILANGDENIVIGNFVDSRLSKLAKTHENVTKYIEKVTGKNIDVVLAENAALEAEEE
ncbi:hypothetical protein M5C73_08835 [Lactococcus lactis]|uniref:hypothetical protein n=1 Tax=Lactococcus lactis TaxID=1358 RepID=UPI0020785009|nr:hypothetical protein [Lactococcus lactis]USI47471.1 hypothetical protein M5C73_08835 [Lactococcus lactis]